MNSNFFKMVFWSFVCIFVVKYFFFSEKVNSYKSQDISGQKFTVPSSRIELEPLNREIDLDQTKFDEKRITLSTDLCDYTFSIFDGSISSIEFKKHKDDSGLAIKTIYDSFLDQERIGTLFLATKDSAPVGFEISDKNFSDPKNYFIEFEKQISGWAIKKRFSFSSENYSVNLWLSLEKKARSSSPLDLRLIFPSPFGTGITPNSVTGVVNGIGNNDAVKISKKDEEIYGWKVPKIFGGEDRYFLNSYYFAEDKELKKENFVKRAYFDRRSEKSLLAILDLWPVEESSQISLNFYFGPKSLPAMGAVNDNFEPILSFGIFSKLSKFLLSLLEYLNSIFNNFGLAIIILTILFKILFFPLFFYSKRRASLYSEFEIQFSKEINEINRKYSSNMIAKTEALTRLYSSHGLSQSGRLLAILPLLVQVFLVIMPLYRVLSSYICLHNAPFYFWITDLSARDPYFILPALLGLASFAQQSVMGTSPGGQEIKGLKYVMPVVMVAIFSNMPAGLVLYWFLNSFFSVFEELIYKNFLKKPVTFHKIS